MEGKIQNEKIREKEEKSMTCFQKTVRQTQI